MFDKVILHGLFFVVNIFLNVRPQKIKKDNFTKNFLISLGRKKKPLYKFLMTTALTNFEKCLC